MVYSVLSDGPLIEEVILQDLNVSNPSVPDFDGIDVVVFAWSDGDLNNRVSWGNELATYLDQGGAIVLWGNRLDIHMPTGRLLTGEYLPFRTAPAVGRAFSDATVTLEIPSTPGPLLEGVSAVQLSHRPLIGEVDSSATVVTTWSDGEPAIGRKGALIQLAAWFDASDTELTGNWEELLQNSVVEAARAAQ